MKDEGVQIRIGEPATDSSEPLSPTAPKKESDPIAPLIDQLNDPIPEERSQAAQQLELFGSRSVAAVQQLTRVATSDVSPVVRHAAIKALGAIGGGASDAMPKLAKLSESENDREICRSAVVAMIHIDPNSQELRRILKKALVGSDSGLPRRSIDPAFNEDREWTCREIEKMGIDAKWASPILQSLLTTCARDIDIDSCLKVFIAAANALGSLGDRTAVDDLERFATGKAKSANQQRAVEAADEALRRIRKVVGEKNADEAKRPIEANKCVCVFAANSRVNEHLAWQRTPP